MALVTTTPSPAMAASSTMMPGQEGSPLRPPDSDTPHRDAAAAPASPDNMPTDSALDSALDSEIDSSLSRRHGLGQGHHRRRSSLSALLTFRRGRKRSDAVDSAEAARQDRREHPFDVDAVDEDGDEAGPRTEAKPDEPIRMLVRKTHRGHHTHRHQTPESVVGVAPERTGPSTEVPCTQAEVAGQPHAPLESHRTAADVDPTREEVAADGEEPAQEQPESQPEPEPVDLLAQSASERHEAAQEIRKQGAMIKEEYVWDVLFENQRGLMFMGTPYFSSRLLFPFDPPAYTIPSHLPRPAPARPTTAAAAQHDPPTHQVVDSAHILPSRHGHSSSEQKDSHPHHAKRAPHPQQSIRTPYTRETYQLPSTQWRWLTPWLINMRQDGATDERGWEYNYWFRTGREKQRFAKRGRGGWGAQVGRWGWGGWVRRRMWVRLRMLERMDMGEVERDLEKEGIEPKRGRAQDPSPLPSPTQEKGADGRASKEHHLGPEDMTVRNIVRAMSARPLDRQRLALWQEWLSGDPGSDEGKSQGVEKAEHGQRLKELVSDDENAETILGAVTYGSARSALLDMWKQQGWQVAAEAD